MQRTARYRRDKFSEAAFCTLRGFIVRKDNGECNIGF